MRSAVVVISISLLAAPALAVENVTISTAATSGGALSGGVFTPTADDANLNISDLKAALTTSDVTVNTGSTGSQSGDITLANKLSWPANALTLNSFHSVIIDAKLSATGTSALKLRTPHGGALIISAPGKITFANTTQLFRIGTTNYTLVADLPTLATDISGNQHGDFALINNYDASTGPTYNNAPITVEFIGDFQGLGNTISNLTINSSATGQSDALFSWLGPDGTIENLTLSNVSVHNSSTSTMVASLVVLNDGDLNNVSASGQVSQTLGGPIGGLVELNRSTMENCFAAVSVSAINSGNKGGGLVGQNDGTISNCSASGTVSEPSNVDQIVGGLAAVNEGLITQSFATGNVTAGTEGIAGGLVALNLNGNIDQSYATGNATGGDTSVVGGLVGQTYNVSSGNTISNSYANGDVTGLSDAQVGGLIGTNSNTTVSFCYSTGSPTATGSFPYIGGFIGTDNGSGTNADNYWSTTSSGITDPSRGAGSPSNDPGITGLTNTQFRSGLPAGFSSSIWGETTGVNFGLPYLLALPPS